MFPRFLYFAVITLLAAVFVPESYAARPRAAGSVSCAGSATCKYWCFGTDSFTGTKCGSFQYCCKANPRKNLCETFGGSCIDFKSPCGDNETIFVRACVFESMKCCKEKPSNPKFQDGVYRIVNWVPVYQQRVPARKNGSRGVNTRRRRLQ